MITTAFCFIIKRNMRDLLLVLFTVISTFTVSAQFDLCGFVIVDEIEQEGVKVYLVGTKDTVLTNNSGQFCFTNLEAGTYQVQGEFLRYESEIEAFTITKNYRRAFLQIRTPYLFEDVNITESLSNLKKDESIKAEIIDLEKHQRSSTSVEKLMNTSTGVKVRNTGGLGAESDVIIGGYNGKSVKFLIDGIPMDYLGSSMSLTMFPTNMAHRIEVYKGVLPTEIGIDALGAAINIVTKPPYKTNHKFSYEIGSFNTHRLSVNSFVRTSDRFSYGVNLFANYSDNNFKVDDLPIDNEETGKTEYVSARLFNNSYKQISGDVYVNFERRKWADLFKIAVNSYGLSRALQNDISSRSKPYGEAFRKERSYVVPSILYNKNLFDNKLHLSQFVVFSSIKYDMIDTAKNVYYDWLGNSYPTISGSEMGMDMSNVKEDILKTTINNLTYRGLITYRFNNKHKLILNLVENYLYRIADDLGNYDAKSFVSYNRFIAALGYQYRFWENRMEGVTQVKLLSSQTEGKLENEFLTEEDDPRVLNTGWSFAQSLKYQENGWLARASVENTYRLPDQMEIFGDNVFILPNLALKPEKSFNVNAGVGYTHKKYFTVELNSYFRNTKDMVRLKEITQFRSAFLNLDKVRGFGIELEAVIYPIKGLELSGNITYNEFRFKGSNDNFSQNEHFIDARVSNMPFYFGNVGASYEFDKLFTQKDKFRVYYTYSYVHQYYLDFIEKQYEPDGVLGLFGHSKIYTDRVIPIQHIHSAGFVWWAKMFKREKTVSFSAEIHNILDSKVYNNFRMQSAGRSFTAKISFEI